MRTQKEVNEFFKTHEIDIDSMDFISGFLSALNLTVPNITTTEDNGVDNLCFHCWFKKEMDNKESIIAFDGTGNILVGIDIIEKGKVSCSFSELEEGLGIGTYIHKSNKAKSKTELTMTFVNSKSIDCIIHKLNTIRDYLKKEEEGIEIPDDLIRLYPFLKTNKI